MTNEVEKENCCVDCGEVGFTWDCRVCKIVKCCSPACQAAHRTCTEHECISEAWHEFKNAVRRQDEVQVARFSQWKSVLTAKQDVIEMDGEGSIFSRRKWTILHECVSRINSKMIAKIMQHATSSTGIADVDKNIDMICGDDGSTPLLYSASMAVWGPEVAAWLDTALTLIELGADVNARDFRGRTPLIRACFSGNMPMFQLLLDSGKANVHIADEDGETPLHACIEGSGWVMGNTVEEVRQAILELIERGADLNAQNARSETPLHIACYDGKPALVDILLELGADMEALEKQGYSPLLTACSWGHVETARRMAAAGANVNHAAGSFGTTPIHTAASKCNGEILRILLEHSANVDPRDGDGNTPLILVCQQTYKLQQDTVVKLLLEAGANVNVHNKRNRTPLHEACKKGSRSIVQILLEHGANAAVGDSDGNSPLAKACARRNDPIDIVELLLDPLSTCGAMETVNWNNSHARGPLHWACSEGNPRVAAHLISHGNADVNARDEESDTPLHEVMFCKEGIAIRMAMARALLEGGAYVHAVNLDGKHALGMASSAGELEMIRLLLDHGAGELEVHIESALVQAAAENCRDMVRLLLQAKNIS